MNIVEWYYGLESFKRDYSDLMEKYPYMIMRWAEPRETPQWQRESDIRRNTKILGRFLEPGTFLVFIDDSGSMYFFFDTISDAVTLKLQTQVNDDLTVTYGF